MTQLFQDRIHVNCKQMGKRIGNGGTPEIEAQTFPISINGLASWGGTVFSTTIQQETRMWREGENDLALKRK